MPRSEPIDDTTPLSAARIDVAARIGWLLRSHRVVGGFSLRQMSAALREQGVSLSASTLSRIESEGQRVPVVIVGYTRVLGLPEGLLRSAVGTLSQSFSYGPPPPPEPPVTLEAYSRAYEAVSGETPTAGAWLEFALRHTGTSGFGVPESQMKPLVARLAREVCRGVSAARLIRVHALLRLLEGPYAELAAGVLRREVEDPDHQNFYDLTGVLSHHPTPETARWGCDLLRSSSIFQVRGGSYLLQGLMLVSGLSLQTWSDLVPQLERAWSQSVGDPARAEAVAQVASALPPSVQRQFSERSGLRPAPPRPPVTWSRSRGSVHYAFASAVAREACVRLGVPEEPLLARLLFEAFFEPRGVRRSLAGVYLAHSAFAGVLPRVLLDSLDEGPDPVSRTAALRVTAFCHTGLEPLPVEPLLDSGDDADLVPALTVMGRSGQSLPERAVARGLAGDEDLVRMTLYALGMAGDPRLEGLAADPGRSASTRRAARWWIERGPRILA